MNKPILPKDNFLEILTAHSPQEINRMIEERGKKTKSVPLVTLIKNSTQNT